MTTGFEGVPPAILDAWRKAHLQEPLLDPGPEWLSLNQLATLWGISQSRTVFRIKKLGERIERSYREKYNKRGYRISIPVYRLKPLKAGKKI